MRAKVYDKQSSKIEYFGDTWSGLAGGNELQLESSSSQSYGKAQIGRDRSILMSSAGVAAVPLREGVDFQYDKRLDASVNEDPLDGFGIVTGGIIDTGVSGVLTKPLRFLNGTKNIKDVTGLNIKVYAKDLSVTSAPPSDRVYVDPIKNIFIMPRPYFLSDTASTNSVTNPSIVPADYTVSVASTQVNASVKFNKGIQVRRNSADWKETIFNLGSSVPSKGAASFWGYTTYTGGAGFHGRLELELGNIPIIVECHPGVPGSYGNSSKIGSDGSLGFIATDSTSLAHYYYVWDVSAGLSGGKTIKIFRNGNLILSGTVIFTTTLPFRFCVRAWNAGGAETVVALSTLKIWNYIPTEDPSFEYNGGTGREDALHPVYSVTDSYKPLDIKTGYYYKSDSSLPATLTQPSAGANVQVTREDISDYSNGLGYFGVGHKIYDTDYSVLAEGTDYVYDEAWDGSGINAIDKYDDGISGALTAQKVIRAVNDISGVAKNIADPTGLNLKPVIKNMPTDNFSPASGEFWVDPVRGKVVLPRPVYWSKCNSISGVVTPEILCGSNPRIVVIYAGEPAVYSGKFTSSLAVIRWGTAGHHMIDIFPDAGVIQKGAASFWLGEMASVGEFTYAGLLCLGTVEVGLVASNGYIPYQNFTLNSTRIGSGLSEGANWHHFLITWDSAKGLSGGKSIRMFCNGVEVQSTTMDLSILAELKIRMYAYSVGPGHGGIIAIDNIKVFNDTIQDPSFEYNAGTGREDALHPIYGATNGYKPKLTGVGGVGYNKASGAGSLVRGTI